MLSEAVESLIFRRFEHLTERIAAGSFHFNRLEVLSTALLLCKYHITFKISEPHGTGSSAYIGFHCRCRYGHDITVLNDFKSSLFSHREHNQTLLVSKLLFRRSRNMDQLVTHHLKADKGRAVFHRLLHFHGHTVLILSDDSCTGTHSEECRKKQKVQFSFHMIMYF